jgi:hypothetical protein
MTCEAAVGLIPAPRALTESTKNGTDSGLVEPANQARRGLVTKINDE